MFPIPIPIIVLFAVFIFVSIRQIGNLRLQIWQLMLFGAIIVLITGQISPNDVLTSINFDVILFLFGVFVIGKALEESGILLSFSSKIFCKAKSTDMLILLNPLCCRRNICTADERYNSDNRNSDNVNAGFAV